MEGRDVRELLGHWRGRDLGRAGKVSIDNLGEGGETGDGGDIL